MAKARASAVAPGANHGVGFLLKAGDAATLAGSCFLVSRFHAVTCAHVIGACLDLGDDLPDAAPMDKIALRLPHGKHQARVEKLGWAPERDIAILALDDPIAANIPIVACCRMELRGSAPAIVTGYQPGHLAKAQTVRGKISFRPTGDGLYEVKCPGEFSGDFRVKGGYSGGPVFDEDDRQVFGMVKEVVESRSIHIAYAVPSIEIEHLMRPIDDETHGLAQVARSRRDDKAKALALKEESEVDRKGDTVLPLLGELKEEAYRQQNRLPDNFSYGVIEIGLDILERLLMRASRGGPGDDIKKLGYQATFLLDLAVALDAMARRDRPDFARLEPLILDLLQTLGGADALPHLEFEPIAWDFELQSALRATLGAIEAELKELEDESDPDLAPTLDQAMDAHLMLRQQVERDRPDWPILGEAGRDMENALNQTDSAMFGELPGLAQEVATRVRAAAETMISDLDDLKSFQDLPDAPVMVVLPAGSFQMGSPKDEKDRIGDEGPLHEVKFEHRMAIGRYPVTFADYDAHAKATGKELPPDEGWGRGRHPVINISRHDAKAYAAWLNERTGATYGLPSEALWEYACRAGTATRYAFGDRMTAESANFDDAVGRTTPVGTYPANAFGIHDMHGNVHESVEDNWHGDYTGAPVNGGAWVKLSDTDFIVRGGAWDSSGDALRSAFRAHGGADASLNTFGYRVFRTLVP